MTVDVSIIVPARDAEATLPDLFAGLETEMAKHHGVELLLVDSGSRDATVRLGRSAGARVIHADQPGAAAARNAGARVARGDYLVFLDSDCRPKTSWLDGLTRPFVDPQVGGAGGQVRAAPPKTLLERYAERRGDITQHRGLADPYLPWVLTANCCYRVDVFEALGGFDARLHSGEDVDFAWRMQLHLGRKLVYAPDAVVEHRHRTTMRGLWRQWVRYGWGSVQLAERYPEAAALLPRRRPVPGWVAERAVRVGRAVAALPTARREPLDVAEPFLDAYIRAAERFGRHRARASASAAEA
jgi:GT2 family glycosyltransferase